jgi:EmrB/QacA subfamily drug resistance transporter
MADGKGSVVPHRGAILTIILCVQLLNTIDITVMNMALPQIQRQFDFSPTGLSWVINAYTLVYGGLLLLGGRLGDILGHRRVLLIGVGVFATASLLGGLAQAEWWLLAARAVQGAAAALTAPSTLALIVRTFHDPEERTRALGISVVASGVGTTGGLLLGGLLTDLGSWRWVLFINVPIGLAVLIFAPRVVPATSGVRGSFDLGGALAATAGMVALVYGFVRAPQSGWTSPVTITAFVVAVVFVVVLIVIESKHHQPMLRLRLFADRNRSAGFLVFVCSAAAMFGMFFFLTQFVQDVLGLRPIEAGVAFLPMAVAMMLMPRLVTPKLVSAIGAKATMAGGLVFVAVSMAWLTQVSASTNYFAGIAGPMLLSGIGVGMLNAPLAGTILATVPREDAGSASGVLQTVATIGGSVGTAILVTVFGSAIRNDPQTAVLGPTAKPVLAHGIATACIGGVAFAIVGLLIVLGVIRTPKPVKAAKASVAPEPATSS